MLKGGLGSMMKKAQEMQTNMQKMQEELGKRSMCGQAGAGAVKIELSGHYVCKKVTLADDAIKEDREMLEALIAAAFNDAAGKVEEMKQKELGEITGTMNLPTGFKLPF